MAPRELFTLAITSEVRLWSMTKAIESGNESVVKKARWLAGVVLVDLEVAEGEAGHQLSLRVLDGDRNFDEVHVHGSKVWSPFQRLAGGGHLWRRGLDLVLALSWRALAAGRGAAGPEG
jgi:hypothetical protein